jgi:hypothetical protein
MIGECENLDAFLANDLSPGDSDGFEAHLLVCDTCLVAVNEQRWIDGLLRSPARIELEPLPATLQEAVCNSILTRRRHARLVACGLAAATVLVVAVGWTVVLNRQSRVPDASQIAKGAVRDEERSSSPTLKERGMEKAPRATFVAGPDVLAVPVASRHPNVTIVRVYTTYQAGLAAKASADDAEADFFNGG